MHGFSWVLYEKLAGLPAPGSFEPLEEDAAFLKEKGVSLLVSLTERPTDADTLARFDVALLHLPIVDFTPPSPDQMSQFVNEARVAIENGGRVGVHCAAGRGRTGTMLAAFLIAEGESAEAAINKIRGARPGSIETREQEASLFEFENRLRQQG